VAGAEIVVLILALALALALAVAVAVAVAGAEAGAVGIVVPALSLARLGLVGLVPKPAVAVSFDLPVRLRSGTDSEPVMLAVA
jgi:hypothetical protein